MIDPLKTEYCPFGIFKLFLKNSKHWAWVSQICDKFYFSHEWKHFFIYPNCPYVKTTIYGDSHPSSNQQKINKLYIKQISSQYPFLPSLVVVSERTRMVKYGTINYAWLRQSSWIAAEASVLAVKQRPLRATVWQLSSWIAHLCQKHYTCIHV